MTTKRSDKKVQALKPQAKAYRLNDDNGLSCLVTPSGKKSSRFRYQWLGREKMLSMGEYPATSLELARKKTLDARALLAQNIDPSAEARGASRAQDFVVVESSPRDLAFDIENLQQYERERPPAR